MKINPIKTAPKDRDILILTKEDFWIQGFFDHDFGKFRDQKDCKIISKPQGWIELPEIGRNLKDPEWLELTCKFQ